MYARKLQGFWVEWQNEPLPFLDGSAEGLYHVPAAWSDEDKRERFGLYSVIESDHGDQVRVASYVLVDDDGVPRKLDTLEAIEVPADLVDSERDRRLSVGAPIVLSSGVSFLAQVDAKSQGIIGNLALGATIAALNNRTFSANFRDADNDVHALSAAEVVELGEQALAFVAAVYASSWAIKDAADIPSDFADDSRWP